MQEIALNPEAAAKGFDLFKLLFMIGTGLVVIIIFFHASYNEQGALFWTLFAIIVPGGGYLIIEKYFKDRTEFALVLPIIVFIAYFLFSSMAGVERAARRARVHAEQRWEFELTNKGMRRDPNIPEGESDYPKPPHPGHRRDVISESPPSRDTTGMTHAGHIKEVIDESPPSRVVEPTDEASQDDTSSSRPSKNVIDESPPSRDIESEPEK